MVVDWCLEGMFDLIDWIAGVQLRDDVNCVRDDDDDENMSNTWKRLASYICSCRR